MDLEEILEEADKLYLNNALFRNLIHTIVEGVMVEVDDDDPELWHCLDEVAKRAASVAVLITERSEGRW